jgi:hypothetical protein
MASQSPYGWWPYVIVLGALIWLVGTVYGVQGS